MSIAEQRLARLESLAERAAKQSEWDLSRAHVRLARRIAERGRLRFPRSFERSTCDRCDVYLRPGVNARVRVHDGRVVITCACGGQSRYGIGERPERTE